MQIIQMCLFDLNNWNRFYANRTAPYDFCWKYFICSQVLGILIIFFLIKNSLSTLNTVSSKDHCFMFCSLKKKKTSK